MLSSEQILQEKEYCIPYKYLVTKEKLIAFPQKLFVSTDYILCQEHIISFLQPFNKQLVLDAGCGDGRLCHALKDKNLTVFGFDYSEQAINFAKIYNPGIDFQQGDLTKKLPYEDNFFDYVILVEVIEHIQPDLLKETVLELKRILKESGRLIITVPHKNKKLAKKHFQHFDTKSLTEILTPSFKIKEIQGFHKADVLLNALFRLIVLIYYYIYPLQKTILAFLVSNTSLLGYAFFKKFLLNCPPDKGLNLICLAEK